MRDIRAPFVILLKDVKRSNVLYSPGGRRIGTFKNIIKKFVKDRKLAKEIFIKRCEIINDIEETIADNNF